MIAVFGVATAILAVIGCVLVIAATAETVRLGRSFARPIDRPPSEPVTILKPLHGHEPRLQENLATFLDQDWGAPTQMICGVQRSDDPAIEDVRTLDQRVELVIDGRAHGANAKVANLINMVSAARHDIVVISDSDIAVPRDYLARVTGSLAVPGVGAVTCAYVGRGDAGFWSRLGAAMLSYHFFPSVALSLRVGAGDVCMGSTIALRRETLTAIGGFEAFADVLADDHAIGAAVRGLGLSVAVAPVLVTHASIEDSAAALVRHELRWAATVRDLRPAGHVGALLLHPLPFAIASLLLAPGLPTAAVLGLALGVRFYSAVRIDRVTRHRPISHLLLPLRDLMTFGVHAASLFVGSVDWRGARLKMRSEGRIEARGA